jgi:hypothetical protein
MLNFLVSGAMGYGLCALQKRTETSGEIGEWSWAWKAAPGETLDRRPLGTVRLTRETGFVEPPTRVLAENAEGFALGYLAGTEQL